MRSVACAAFLAILLSHAPALAQDDAGDQKGKTRITGRVLAADTGAPLQRAQVVVRNGTRGFQRTAVTDLQGRYDITGLPADRYTLTASKNGYLTLAYGQRRPSEAGRPIAIADAQTLERVDFPLPRSSVIVVRVSDEFGEPVVGATVKVERYGYANGQRRLVAAGSSESAFAARTDDLGQLRVFGLAPGEYYVSASTSGPGRPLQPTDEGTVYGATFYPGTVFINDAQPLTLGVGQEVFANVSLVRVRAARISGRVIASNGAAVSEPLAGLTERRLNGWSSRSFQVRPDGTFTLADVLPGDYSIEVMPPLSGEVREQASLPIKVTGQDMTGLVITTSPGATLRGQFVFEGAATLKPGSVTLISAPGLAGPSMSVSDAKWNDDWTFEMHRLFGRQVVRLGPRNPPDDWALKAIMLDGRDVTDAALDFDASREIKDLQVVLTRRQAEVIGDAVDARKAPVADFVVVVFPEDRGLWTTYSRHIATGRADQSGRFRVAGLPQGRYLVAAVDALEVGEERDPQFLQRLANRAVRLSLEVGESKTLQLTVTDVP